MKICKACKKKIDQKATKCPYCQTNQKSWFGRHPILTILLILFVISYWSIASNTLYKNSASSIKNSEATPAIDNQWYEDTAQSYFASHQNMFIGMTLESAKETMRLCINEFKNKKDCENIIDKKFWIGMPSKWTEISMGSPNDINTTVVGDYKQEQWVYGNPIYGATYLYFEKGILTSYQN